MSLMIKYIVLVVILQLIATCTAEAVDVHETSSLDDFKKFPVSNMKLQISRSVCNVTVSYKILHIIVA